MLYGTKSNSLSFFPSRNALCSRTIFSALRCCFLLLFEVMWPNLVGAGNTHFCDSRTRSLSNPFATKTFITAGVTSIERTEGVVLPLKTVILFSRMWVHSMRWISSGRKPISNISVATWVFNSGLAARYSTSSALDATKPRLFAPARSVIFGTSGMMSASSATLSNRFHARRSAFIVDMIQNNLAPAGTLCRLCGPHSRIRPTV